MDTRQTRLFESEVSWYEDRAQGLVSARLTGVPQALAQIRDWHPRFANASDDVIRQAAFDIADAKLVYARQHGFETWEELAARVTAIAAGEVEEAEEPFMVAFLALKAGDLERLRALLQAHPDLARARGTNGNTLLNLAGNLAGGALCVNAREDERARAMAIIDTLIEAGSDVNEANVRGWTPLHQAAYSNQLLLAERLLAAGAAASLHAEAHGSGGTPLIMALFWGHREAADMLAAHDITPRNLRTAAGLGDLAMLESFFAPDGSLKPEAGHARGFVRPHSGFPEWTTSSDPQEVLDEALVWACKSDRVEVLERLVRGGARIDADPYRGTPLLWAASRDRRRAVRWLIEHGADVNQRATFGGPGHGQGVTALHLAAQHGDLAMVSLLVELGADLTIEDDLYQGRPVDWAQHGGEQATWDYLRSLQAGSER